MSRRFLTLKLGPLCLQKEAIERK